MSLTLVASPRTANHMPSPALAALKPCVEQAGFVCNTIDLNIELYTDLKKNYNEFKEIDSYFQTDLRYISQDELDLSPLLEQKNILSKPALDLYMSHLHYWADYIMSLNNEWIGVSVLSVNSVLYTVDLCEVLKQKSNCKIMLGGPGVSTFGISGASNFGEFMIATKLSDAYISGEGERSIVALLKG